MTAPTRAALNACLTCTKKSCRLHKKAPYRSQLMHTVAFPPSSTASAVPLWRLFNLHTYKGPGVIRWPSFFTCNIFPIKLTFLGKQTLFASECVIICVLAVERSTHSIAVPLWRSLTFKLVGRGEILRPSFFPLPEGLRKIWGQSLNIDNGRYKY